MKTNFTKITYATYMGLFFALLQTGYFFQLAIWLTAAYPSFLTVTLAWLVGSVVGLYSGKFPGNQKIWAPLWLVASLVAYYLSLILLRTYPYDIQFIPFYGAMVLISGVQAGRFFQDNHGLFDKVSRLFFHENNGFVAGWIIGFLGFVWFSNAFNWIAPGLLGLVSVIMITRTRRNREAL